MTAPPLSNATKRCLALAAARSDRGASVADALNAVFDLDLAPWVDVMLRVGAAARCTPSAEHEAAERAEGSRELDVDIDRRLWSTTRLYAAVDRARDLAGQLDAEVTAPVHLVLAVIDDPGAAGSLPAGVQPDELRAAISDLVLGADLPTATVRTQPSPESTALARPSPPDRPLPDDLAEVVGRAEELAARRGSRRSRRRRRTTTALMGVGAIALALATACALGVKAPWIVEPEVRATRAADHQAELGHHGAAIRHYAEALVDKPDHAPALKGMTCELWSIGYRDDALRYLQRYAQVAPKSAPKWRHGDEPCVADDAGRYGIGWFDGDVGIVIVAVPRHRPKEVQRLIDLTHGSTDSAMLLTVAACLDDRAGLHLLAMDQLALAHRIGGTLPARSPLRSCAGAIQRRDPDLGASGRLEDLSDEVREQVYVAGSPIPAPRVVTLPPPDH